MNIDSGTLIIDLGDEDAGFNTLPKHPGTSVCVMKDHGSQRNTGQDVTCCEECVSSRSSQRKCLHNSFYIGRTLALCCGQLLYDALWMGDRGFAMCHALGKSWLVVLD